MSEIRLVRLITVLAILGWPFGGTFAQEHEPATAAEAAAVLDLSKFPLQDPFGETEPQVIASQSYLSTGKVLEVSRKIQNALQKSGWQELEGASYTDAYSSASFEKNGFSVSMNVMPGGANESIAVSLFNHGNVDLKALPKPAAANVVYAMPMQIMLTADSSVAETNAAYKRLLAEEGWENFGNTTVSFFVKKNAVRLQVMISEAPAQPGKTTIQISSEQLSFDWLAPPEASAMNFSDPTGQMMFDTAKSPADCVAWFKERLGKTGWEATTDNLIKIDFSEYLILRGPAGELLEIAFSNVEEKTRVALKYKSAAQVSTELKKSEKHVAEMLAERTAELERKTNPSKIGIMTPVGATVKEKDKTNKRIEFSIATGTAKSALAGWIKKLQSDGWESKVLVDLKEAGEYELTKDGARLNAGYVDPGFIAGSITIAVWGDYQLELSK